jgi:hypothetical protein
VSDSFFPGDNPKEARHLEAVTATRLIDAA